MSEKRGVSQDNPDPFPTPEYVHLYERPEPKADVAVRQNHLVMHNVSLFRLLEAADKMSVSGGWRVVPGSVQVLNILHHELREGVGRVETYEHRYVLAMERDK